MLAVIIDSKLSKRNGSIINIKLNLNNIDCNCQCLQLKRMSVTLGFPYPEFTKTENRYDRK